MNNANFWLRLEGLVLFILAIMIFSTVSGSWLLFVLLLLVPDISMIGYGINNKVGAWVYNAGHSLVLPLLVAGFGYLYLHQVALEIGLIWLAHIGMDRVFGFGLKDENGFKTTHLGKIGQKRKK